MFKKTFVFLVNLKIKLKVKDPRQKKTNFAPLSLFAPFIMYTDNFLNPTTRTAEAMKRRDDKQFTEKSFQSRNRSSINDDEDELNNLAELNEIERPPLNLNPVNPDLQPNLNLMMGNPLNSVDQASSIIAGPISRNTVVDGAMQMLNTGQRAENRSLPFFVDGIENIPLIRDNIEHDSSLVNDLSNFSLHTVVQDNPVAGPVRAVLEEQNNNIQQNEVDLANRVENAREAMQDNVDRLVDVIDRADHSHLPLNSFFAD
jgi:hypothetical protein